MKRKYFGALLCVVVIVGVLFTVGLQKKNSKSEIFNYVRENQAHLSQFVADIMDTAEKDSTYGNWSVTYYEDSGTVEFLTKGRGIGSATVYEGFYYSEHDIPIGFQGTELAFIPNGDGWIWQETDGDNHEQTERIMTHWFWFEMSF